MCCKNPNFFSEEEMELKYNYALKYITFRSKGYKFVFLDEQSWNLTEAGGYGWEEKRKSLIIERQDKMKPSLSLIAAITHKGILCFRIFQGGVL